MTTNLPYRAQVLCSLGHLIDGQFADTYLQQAGLIFCRGSIQLAGIFRPGIGTAVDFAYTRGTGTAARIPRRLRVLSSFADPFTKITTVQIGCTLSLMRETRKTDKATPQQTYAVIGPSGGSGIEVAREYVAPPVKASIVADQCLTAIGVTPAAALPLLNYYTVDEIDLSSGYVDVLAKLLESELYVGWMNDEDELELRSLQNDTTALGPVINATNCFTLSPIGVGERPAEEIEVEYYPVILRPSLTTINEPTGDPTEAEKEKRLDNLAGWNSSITYGLPIQYSIAYTSSGIPQTFSGVYTPVQETESTFANGLMIRSITATAKPYAAVAGKYASQALSNGVAVPTVPVLARTQTDKTYDEQRRELKSIVTEAISFAEFAGSLDLTFVKSSTDYVSIPEAGEVVSRKTVTDYLYSGSLVRRETHYYGNWALTQAGQQAISEGRNALSATGAVSAYINSLVGAPAYLGTEVSISNAGPQAQELPGPAALAVAAYGKQPNDVATQKPSVTSSSVSYAGVQSRTKTTYTLPFTAHSYFNSLVAGQWTVVDVSVRTRALALNYGRIQNRLRLGNTEGVSIQMPVELLPTKPFDAIYLQADNLTGQYRANGMSWTFDQNGIVGQVDALFWLGTGQTGSPGTVWFPMPPGVSSLPTTPSVTVNGSPVPANSASLPGGWDPAAPDLTTLFTTTLPTGVEPVFPTTLNVEGGLQPFSETVAVDAITTSVLAVNEYPYSLAPQSNEANFVTKEIFEGLLQTTVLVPAASTSLVLATFAPGVSAAAFVGVPQTVFTITALLPSTGGTGLISVPQGVVTLLAPPPTLSPSPVGGIDVGAITYSQHSVYSGNTAATNANMTNGITAETTATATLGDSSAYVRMDLGAVYSVSNIYVGCDFTNTLAGGWGSTYSDNRPIEYSTDGTTWTSAGDTGTFTTALKTFSVSFNARYIQLRSTIGQGFVVCTEFYAT